MSLFRSNKSDIRPYLANRLLSLYCHESGHQTILTGKKVGRLVTAHAHPRYTMTGVTSRPGPYHSTNTYICCIVLHALRRKQKQEKSAKRKWGVKRAKPNNYIITVLKLQVLIQSKTETVISKRIMHQ
jgi:hypothetical protein